MPFQKGAVGRRNAALSARGPPSDIRDFFSPARGFLNPWGLPGAYTRSRMHTALDKTITINQSPQMHYQSQQSKRKKSRHQPRPNSDVNKSRLRPCPRKRLW